MSLSIVIEDGTGLPDSETYVSVDDLRAFAAKRAVVLPVSDDDLIPSMIEAMDYIEARIRDYVGDPQTDGQMLAFPRVYPTTNALGLPLGMYSELYPFGFGGFDYNDGFLSNLSGETTTEDLPLLTAGTIPTQIIKAQCLLTLLVIKGVELQPVSNGQFIIEDKLGPIETKYSEILSSGTPTFPMVDALLNPFLQSGGRIKVQRG